MEKMKDREYPELDIAIIGAGMSGLLLAYRLKSRGFAFTIYEKAAEVGGTWRENTYPGLHVDVVTRAYEFSFARRWTWSRRYAAGPEIRGYLRDVASQLGLAEHVRFGQEITDARFEDGAWTLETKQGDRHRHDVVFAATGFLHHPVIPKIPGRDAFTGPAFHSARWDHTVDLAGKHIGVIGTGSSGIQIVSELGKRGHQVTQFIRTPQWVLIKENPRISWIERVLLRVPGLASYWDKRMAKLRVQTDGSENWKVRPGPEREEMTRRFTARLEHEIPDPELRAKLTPPFPPGCKRIPKSPDYYRVLQSDNVRAVFGPVARIEPDGIVDAAGKLHKVDVIVFATGFDSHAYMRPMRITGAGGVTLEDLWRESVFAYHAIGLPMMPNFFMLSGPFAPVNSIPPTTSVDDEAVFLLQLLDIIRSRRAALAPTVAATEAFCKQIEAAAPDTTYVLCSNWYRDRTGTPVIWPWGRVKHREQYLTVDLQDFDEFAMSAAISPAAEGRH